MQRDIENVWSERNVHGGARGFKDFKDCAALTVYSADTQTSQLNKGYKHIKNISSN